jgi:hypothetical protein
MNFTMSSFRRIFFKRINDEPGKDLMNGLPAWVNTKSPGSMEIHPGLCSATGPDEIFYGVIIDGDEPAR